MDALGTQVADAAFSLPRVALGREAWVLEPPAVRELLQRLRDAGAPLRDFACITPMYGLKTGLNEAFFVDTPTRDQLVASNPDTAELLKRLLRGQDIGRWATDWDGVWLIELRSSGDHPWPWAQLNRDAAEQRFRIAYPALYDHMMPHRAKLMAREDQGRFWWELRSCAYYEAFSRDKIVYQVIQYAPGFSIDREGHLLNDKGFFLPTGDPWLVGVLNSPLLWWICWRHLPHMKDEALNPAAYRMESLPIAAPTEPVAARVANISEHLGSHARERHAARRTLRDWLATTWELPKPPTALTEPFALSADAFAQALRAALPARRRSLSAAAVAAIRTEHAATIAPATARLAEASRLENELSRLVNQAYGLTPEDERLMWATAPPRMPIAPPTD
jgi:hypothetical protein